MNRTARVAGLGSVALLALLMSDTGAQGVQVQPQLYTSTRGGSSPPKYTLPPEPALPSGCVLPAKEQCADAGWYKTDACAKDPAKAKAMQDLCVWVFQKAWVDTQSTQHQTLFPTSPPNTVYPILTPGRLMQNGKSVNAVNMNRPPEKQRLSGGGRAGVRTPAPQPGTLDFTPNKMRAGGGSYAGLHTATVVPDLASVHAKLEPFRRGGAKDAELRAGVPGLVQQLQQRPSFVTTPGAGVSSCEEYAYKRWGEWSDFSNAGKKLGANYRQVYKNATNPSSPFFINKQVLNQTGTNTRIPVRNYFQLYFEDWFGNYNPTYAGGYSSGLGRADPWLSADSYWPANPFIVRWPYWLTDPKATMQGDKPLITGAEVTKITALIGAQWINGNPRMVKARNPTPSEPLAPHVEMKQLFDTKYGDPLDDELMDADKRTGVYQDLVGKADQLRIELTCTEKSDPCFQCSEKPDPGNASLPGAIQKVKDKITGYPVMNPGDIASALQGGSPAARIRALRVMSSIGGAYEDLYRGPSPGGAKPRPVLGDDKRGPRQPETNEHASCIKQLEARRPALEKHYYTVTQQLTKMLVNELKFDERGCLAKPGREIGNLCDWSYAKFAAFTTTLFDDAVESDFQQCRGEINTAMAALDPKPPGNSFTAVLKHPPNQALAFPCVQRRDFTGNAPDANWFLRLNANYLGRFCEAARQTLSVVDQQAAIADELSGIHFKDGEIYDATADENTLGDKGSLGAYFNYDASWDMKKTALYKGNDPMKACRFEGSGGTNVKAGIMFFGDELELFRLNSQGQSAPKKGGPQTPTVAMTASYFDIDSFKAKDLTDGKLKSVKPGADYAVQFVDPPINLGGIEYGFWIQVGPIPLHIKFGATATAGLDYRFAAKTGDNCNEPWVKGVPTKPTGFRFVSEVEPWVRADAYADASVDIVVASAGVRLDLELLKLGLPLGVNVHSEGKSYSFKNGMTVAIDMLAGKFVAYVSVGIGPLSAEYDVTIFQWDGFHTDVPLWGLDKTVPETVVRVAMANSIDPGKVTCACTETFCCSGISCSSKKGCDGQLKKVNGEDKICTFNQTDYERMSTSTDPKLAPFQTVDMPKCQWFVR